MSSDLRRRKLGDGDLVAWLKANSSGVYGKSAVAAERIEELLMLAERDRQTISKLEKEVASERVR